MKCGPWRVQKLRTCRLRNQNTKWMLSTRRLRDWRHVGFQPRSSQPRRKSSGTNEEVAQPYLSAIDSRYGRCLAVKCVTKGSQDEYAVKALEIFCRQLGTEKFFLQSDPEPSIQDVVGKVCTKAPGGMARITPKQSKQSLGLAERFHGTVESDCRVLLLSILNSYKIEFLPPMHPIFDWLVRHAAWVHERFRRSRHDGRTAFARHMLREYPSQVLPFGETVIFRDTGPIKCKLRTNWNFGVWLGRDSQDDMHVLGTRQGIVKARSVKRTTQSERYDQQLLLQMKGRPYDIRGDKVIEEPPTVQITPGLRSSSPSAEPMASTEPSSEPSTETTPAVSSDVPEKEDTNQMDIEQQNMERRQDETVEMSPEVPATRPRGKTNSEDVSITEGRGFQVELLSLCWKELLPQGRMSKAWRGDAVEGNHEVLEAGRARGKG